MRPYRDFKANDITDPLEKKIFDVAQYEFEFSSRIKNYMKDLSIKGVLK